MKARPILFSAPMVRALIDGRKTQTRRIMKPWFGKKYQLFNLKENGDPTVNYSGLENDPLSWGYPYAEDGAADIAIGDKYWANLFCPYGSAGDFLWVRETIEKAQEYGGIGYPADGTWYPASAWEWKRDVVPSIHMPRRLSRITLEITSVRVEKLRAISEADAIAEGFSSEDDFHDYWFEINPVSDQCVQGDGEDDPWVWVIEFKVHKQNVDEILKARAA